jgi:predicted DsbA family dithiol-disulfide isomerase
VSNASLTLTLELWSDVVCPWCYVGRRRLQRALGQFAHADRVSLVHRSFQLDPWAPKGGTRSRREMLMAKYRLSEDQVQALDARMADTMAAEGLEYRVDDTVTGNTGDAHRLLQLAREQGRQDALLDRFYRAYFAEGRSLFDDESLAALAVDAGLDQAAVAETLQGTRFADAVQADQAQARALGVTGVPFLVIGGRHSISGAHDVDVVRDALERAWEASRAD